MRNIKHNSIGTHDRQASDQGYKDQNPTRVEVVGEIWDEARCTAHLSSTGPTMSFHSQVHS